MRHLSDLSAGPDGRADGGGLERGTDVGGTWHWNRYPGCRFDSESETYGYRSRRAAAEWNWSEHFAPRHETERYLKTVAEKFGLYERMQFESTVTSACWDESSRAWTVRLANGRELTTRFLLTAIGLLSHPRCRDTRG